MPRRREVPKRIILPDPKFNDKVVAKLINTLMLAGKKSVAESIMYGALELVAQRANDEAVKVLKKSLDNIKPSLEVKSRRVGGSTYQVPIEVRQERGTSIALRWIRDFAKTKKGKSMEQKLAEEIMAAYKGEGSAIKKRDDTHKMAEANKAFAHFRW